MIKRAAKGIANGIALLCMFPFAALSGFGRITSIFQIFSQWAALFPGLPGDYLRVAYYAMTLEKCPLYSRISFGTIFPQSSVRLDRVVYIGAYCVFARCHIGAWNQIGSHVQIFGGGHQHGRDSEGRILASDEQTFTAISMGEDLWLGAAAMVMAVVGSGTTIGAGAVVTQPIPDHVVAVGNPARVLKGTSA